MMFTKRFGAPVKGNVPVVAVGGCTVKLTAAVVGTASTEKLAEEMMVGFPPTLAPTEMT